MEQQQDYHALNPFNVPPPMVPFVPPPCINIPPPPVHHQSWPPHHSICLPASAEQPPPLLQTFSVTLPGHNSPLLQSTCPPPSSSSLNLEGQATNWTTRESESHCSLRRSEYGSTFELNSDDKYPNTSQTTEDKQWAVASCSRSHRSRSRDYVSRATYYTPRSDSSRSRSRHRYDDYSAQYGRSTSRKDGIQNKNNSYAKSYEGSRHARTHSRPQVPECYSRPSTSTYNPGRDISYTYRRDYHRASGSSRNEHGTLSRYWRSQTGNTWYRCCRSNLYYKVKDNGTLEQTSKLEKLCRKFYSTLIERARKACSHVEERSYSSDSDESLERIIQRGYKKEFDPSELHPDLW